MTSSGETERGSLMSGSHPGARSHHLRAIVSNSQDRSVSVRMVVDSSFLRSPDLEAFLRGSPDNKAVLTEVTAFESYKGDPFKNALRNIEICGRFGPQIVVLRCMRDILEEERQRPLSPADYIDTEQTEGVSR